MPCGSLTVAWDYSSEITSAYTYGKWMLIKADTHTLLLLFAEPPQNTTLLKDLCEKDGLVGPACGMVAEATGSHKANCPFQF